MSFEPKPYKLSETSSIVMTERQAAKYIKKSAKTLYRRRKNGQISYIDDDGRISYLKDDLDAYLAARRVAATAPHPAERKTKYRKTSIRSEANRSALLDII